MVEAYRPSIMPTFDAKLRQELLCGYNSLVPKLSTQHNHPMGAERSDALAFGTVIWRPTRSVFYIDQY